MSLREEALAAMAMSIVFGDTKVDAQELALDGLLDWMESEWLPVEMFEMGRFIGALREEDS